MADYEIDNTPSAIYKRDLEIAVDEKDQGMALEAVWSIMEDILDSVSLAMKSDPLLDGREDVQGSIIATVRDYMMNNYGED